MAKSKDRTAMKGRQTYTEQEVVKIAQMYGDLLRRERIIMGEAITHAAYSEKFIEKTIQEIQRYRSSVPPSVREQLLPDEHTSSIERLCSTLLHLKRTK